MPGFPDPGSPDPARSAGAGEPSDSAAPAAAAGLMLPAPLAAAVTRTRGAGLAARVGIALGVAVAVCFCTGLISHWIQHPPGWFAWPVHPVWLYRVTQGAHVISGVVAIPLVLVKLWAVYPRLFARPLLGNPLRLLERGSIALLVGAILFQLVTGLFNTAQFYPWKFFFTTTHYAMAYVAAGALLVHLAVKLPVVRAALARPEDDRSAPAVAPAHSAASTSKMTAGQPIARRALLTAAGIGAAVAALSVAGQTIPYLRWLAILSPRSGQGPQGVPVNRTAAAAGVSDRARAADYRLTVDIGGDRREFTRADLEALPQVTADLPIACVEGWSAAARWTGVRLRDLLATVGPYPDRDVRFESLETGGIYRTSILPARHVHAPDTLVALRLNGEDLVLDHGYPCRLIAPNRPGVLQTKWLSRIEVLA